MGFWGETSIGNTDVVNTDGAPGTTIFVGVLDPRNMDPAPTLEVGDVWIRIPQIVYPATVATVFGVGAPTVTT